MFLTSKSGQPARTRFWIFVTVTEVNTALPLDSGYIDLLLSWDGVEQKALILPLQRITSSITLIQAFILLFCVLSVTKQLNRSSKSEVLATRLFFAQKIPSKFPNEPGWIYPQNGAAAVVYPLDSHFTFRLWPVPSQLFFMRAQYWQNPYPLDRFCILENEAKKQRMLAARKEFLTSGGLFPEGRERTKDAEDSVLTKCIFVNSDQCLWDSTNLISETSDQVSAMAENLSVLVR